MNFNGMIPPRRELYTTISQIYEIQYTEITHNQAVRNRYLVYEHTQRPVYQITNTKCCSSVSSPVPLTSASTRLYTRRHRARRKNKKQQKKTSIQNALHQRKHHKSAVAPPNGHRADDTSRANPAAQFAGSAALRAATRRPYANRLHAGRISQCGRSDTRSTRQAGRCLGDWLSGQRDGCRAVADRPTVA